MRLFGEIGGATLEGAGSKHQWVQLSKYLEVYEVVMVRDLWGKRFTKKANDRSIKSFPECCGFDLVGQHRE